jgi:hypothetical protein
VGKMQNHLASRLYSICNQGQMATHRLAAAIGLVIPDFNARNMGFLWFSFV